LIQLRRRDELRSFPYPYRCAVALSNDAEFMTPKAFWDLHRLLDGLGLPVTDSVFMYSVDSRRSFSYFEGTTTEPSRHAGWLREAMQAGVIDVLHAFGDFDGVGGCTRTHAEAALAELDRANVRLRVWTNHGSAENTQNLGGRQATYQRGDLPGSEEYHADLTTAYGVTYCWLDWNATNAVGQDRVPVRRRFRRETRRDDPLLSDEQLRDGSQVRVFQRYRGPDRPDPATLAAQLSAAHLDELSAAEGVMIVYQHLGCDRRTGTCRNNEPPYLPADALSALRRLAERYDDGEILVLGVGELLRYCDARSRVRVESSAQELRLSGIDRDALGGLTFYAEPGTRIVLDGDEVVARANPADATGRTSVTVALPTWELPPTPADHHLEV
jgi:hypothetical protein